MFRSTLLALALATLAGGTALAGATGNDGKPFATGNTDQPAVSVQVAGATLGEDGKARGIRAADTGGAGTQIAAFPKRTDRGR